MPAPYALLDMPPGDFSNMFDFPAINMAAAHNMFIQGINSMVAHAPYVKGEKVQPFVFFCLTVLGVLHHHHTLEETFYFPALEKKLGEGYLEGTAEQHSHFVPQVEETERWLKDVKDLQTPYDAQKLLGLIDSFSDKMFEHLNHEVKMLDREVIREHFTEKELRTLDEAFMKLALSGIDFYSYLPMALVCSNPATLWFPPLPLPLRWATRWWFSRRHSASWEFGALDFAGNEKPLPAPPA